MSLHYLLCVSTIENDFYLESVENQLVENLPNSLNTL